MKIPTKNSIKLYFHCSKCLKELPVGVSPRDYASNEIGWTKLGLQVWCKRHKLNVMHIDFEKVTHPANLEGK